MPLLQWDPFPLGLVVIRVLRRSSSHLLPSQLNLLTRLAHTSISLPEGLSGHFNVPFEGGSGCGDRLPTASAQIRAIRVCNVSFVRVVCTCLGETLPIVSLFNFIRIYLERLDARPFCFGLRTAGHNYCMNNRDATQVTSGRGWAQSRLHPGGRGTEGFDSLANVWTRRLYT